VRGQNTLAALLVAPLLLLLTAAFLVPLANTLATAVADRELRETLPRSAALLRSWDGTGLPGEEAFATLAEELGAALAERRLGPLTQRMNFAVPGSRALLLRTARASGSLAAPFASTMVTLDARWGETDTWLGLRDAAGPFTPLYLLRALDLDLTPGGSVTAMEEQDRLFRTLFLRTIGVALLVTLLAIPLAAPVAFLLASLPPRWAGLALLAVLVPFWSSILVRTTAWFVLLQREGPVNAALVALGLADAPVQIIGTRAAVIVAMLHVLLPFAILPAYSVMKGIDRALLRAASSLGGSPVQVTLRVWLPLAFPGLAAGGFIVFLLAVGFYITPALLGGPRDQLVASFIALHINRDVNWGMAAALSVLLLGFAGLAVAAARVLLPGVLKGRFAP
jgi:putative spermidine/putrescine transport system permease protein